MKKTRKEIRKQEKVRLQNDGKALRIYTGLRVQQSWTEVTDEILARPDRPGPDCGRISEYEASMSGIFSTSVCAETLDESPQAYKPSEEILSLITPTVDVISFVIPKFNIKDTGK